MPVIIDNRGDNKVLHALQKLLPNLQSMDIATGVFEVGSFLLLEGFWQNLNKIRILMGDETTRRTRREIVKELLEKSNESIEQEKERDDVPERWPPAPPDAEQIPEKDQPTLFDMDSK